MASRYSVIREFYPSLIPSTSYCPGGLRDSLSIWIHLITYRLREYFQPIMKSDRPRVDRALFQLSDFALRTVNHLQKIEAEFRAVRDDLSHARSDLDLARCRITAMESSKFWRLRRHWFRVKRALHLPGWDRE